MPLSVDADTGVGATLDRARRERRSITPPGELAAMSLQAAYDVQDAVVGLRELAGASRSGWKLAATSDAERSRLGVIDRPAFGYLFSDGARTNESRVAHAEFIAPRVEPELAFGLGATLDPNAHPTTYLRAIAWVAPALEISDSRYADGPRSAVELVADNASVSAYVLGTRVSLGNAPRLDAIETHIVCNDTVLAAGNTADVLGNPIIALRLLVMHLARRGLRATAGDVILSGAITDAFAAAPGHRFEAHLRGLASVAIGFR